MVSQMLKRKVANVWLLKICQSFLVFFWFVFKNIQSKF